MFLKTSTSTFFRKNTHTDKCLSSDGCNPIQHKDNVISQKDIFYVIMNIEIMILIMNDKDYH